MAIWDNIDSVNAVDAPNHWEMRTDNSGIITITENRVGNLTSICEWVNSYVVGNQQNPSGFEGTPKNAVFYVSGKTVSMQNAGITQGSVSWSTASGEGDSSTQTGGALSASESVDFNLVETPLGLNGNFVKDVPETEVMSTEWLDGVTTRKAIQLYISESDPETAKNYKAAINGYNKEAGKWAEKMLAGVTHYLEPSPTASRTEETTTSPGNIGSGVGLTGSPSLEKINMGFTSNWAWLKSGDSVQWSSQTGRFTRTQSWIACRGKWDEDIYKDASSSSGSGSGNSGD